MEWERAKTYILLFFVIVNVFLGGFLLMERRRYTVSNARQQAIVEIMAQNNITMDARILRRFPPMRLINVSGFYYDENELIEIFFGNATVGRSSNARGYVFTHGQGELSIAHGFISYYNTSGHGGPGEWLTNVSRTEAQSLTDAFVGQHFSDFRLDDVDVFVDQGLIRFSYRQVYRGYVIHSNFVELIVTDRGIVQVDMQFGQILDMDRERHPIAAPDEVLLTFVQRVWQHALISPMVVIHMDLVYFQDEGSPDPERPYRLEPFYRVFIAGDEGDPLLINALTNEIIN
ncbi:MAG: hypothetical protein FWE11_04915 [Defluviitaleaceae bacterium]|nr:hypothetical protein [Defluviitaleaceae bacterium]